MTVLAWIMDRKFLAGIPAHYLTMGPSFLPPESLRFFQIDQSWMDAMIDGALSIGNHLESHDDKIRAAIKRAVNRYCKTPISQLNRPPQIPSFGFFMRSDLVTQFPDLKVEAHFDPPLDHTCAPILRHENIADGVMLCLFDRVPGKGDKGGLKAIQFTQPPHQQSFSIGSKLDEVELHPTYRHIYCEYDGSSNREDTLEGDNTKKWYNPIHDPPPPEDSNAPVFVWGQDNEIRTLIFPSYPDDVFKRLHDKMPKKADGNPTFTDDAATAAMVGIALNDSCYELIISLGQQDIKPQPHMLFMMNAWSAPSFFNTMAPSLIELEPPPVASAIPALKDRPDLDTTDDSLAPHQRTVFEASEETQQVVEQNLNDKGSSAAVLNKPNFQYDIYPIATERDMSGPVTSIKVESNGGYAQDLVFSIVLDRGNLVSTLCLQEIQFIIEMGPVINPDKNFLISSYTGPGPTMLSNLRFNVMVERMQTALLLRVVPRTTKPEGVPWYKVNEASFVLSMVEVNHYKESKLAYVKYGEKYDKTGWFRRWIQVQVTPTAQQ